MMLSDEQVLKHGALCYALAWWSCTCRRNGIPWLFGRVSAEEIDAAFKNLWHQAPSTLDGETDGDYARRIGMNVADATVVRICAHHDAEIFEYHSGAKDDL